MIKYLNYYVPEKRLSCQEIFSDADKKDKLPKEFNNVNEGVEFFKNSLDLDEVTHADSMSEVELLTPLLEDFFDKEIVKQQEIDVIIIIGDELIKGTRMDNIGQYVQHKFKMTNADVLTFSGNHCSNIEHAVSCSESFLKSGDYNNIIILAINKLIRDEERIIGTYGIQGDAAGIVFLNNDTEKGIKLLGKHSYTNGTLYKASLDYNDSFLICKNYLMCLTNFVKKFKIVPAEIDNIVVQNANFLLINQCLNSLGFKEEQVFLEKLNSYGHLDCVDFIVNLKAILEKETKPSRKIMSFGTGWAGSNICLLMEVSD